MFVKLKYDVIECFLIGVILLIHVKSAACSMCWKAVSFYIKINAVMLYNVVCL